MVGILIVFRWYYSVKQSCWHCWMTTLKNLHCLSHFSQSQFYFDSHEFHLFKSFLNYSLAWPFLTIPRLALLCIPKSLGSNIAQMQYCLHFYNSTYASHHQFPSLQCSQNWIFWNTTSVKCFSYLRFLIIYDDTRIKKKTLTHTINFLCELLPT